MEKKYFISFYNERIINNQKVIEFGELYSLGKVGNTDFLNYNVILNLFNEYMYGEFYNEKIDKMFNFVVYKNRNELISYFIENKNLKKEEIVIYEIDYPDFLFEEYLLR